MSETVLVSLLAAAIAFLGVCIAWGQWHTARQKLVFDLFERRVALIDDVEALVSRGRRNDFEAWDWHTEMRPLLGRAKYLFGADVNVYLATLDDAVYDRLLALSTRKLGTMDAAELAEAENEIKRGGSTLKAFRETFDTVCVPYLRMDQKLPLTPWQWLKNRWANRPDGTE